MRQVEVEGIRWLEVKVLNEENICKEIASTVSVFPLFPLQLYNLYTAVQLLTEVLTNVIEMHAACIDIDGAASAATSVTQLVRMQCMFDSPTAIPFLIAL